MNKSPAATTARPPQPTAPGAAPESIPPFLRSLEVFLAVHEQRSFSAAAKKLRISQPTVSQRIQGLEKSLGIELFHRRQGAVELAQGGKTLVVYAERMLALRDEMVAQIRGLLLLQQGTLRIAASTTPGNYVMPPLLQRFRERFSGIRVVLRVANSDEVIEQVREGVVEFGVVGSPVADVHFLAEPFIEDEMVIIAPPRHPVLATEEVAPSDLAAYTWVVRGEGSGTRRSAEEILSQLPIGRQIRVGMVLDSTEAIKLAVRAGEGIALVSRRAVENEVALGLLGFTRLPGTWRRRHFFLVRSQHRTLSPAAAGLWEHLLGAGRIGAAPSTRGEPGHRPGPASGLSP
ncbi:MAG: LysR family transcriptional regulator [Myxococcales bacterium]|nr:LysR family transcriptional regulator [Myxococcales bacterium]